MVDGLWALENNVYSAVVECSVLWLLISSCRVAGAEGRFCLWIIWLAKLLSCTWLERAGFRGDFFFWFVSSGVFVLPAVLVPSLGSIRQRDNPGNSPPRRSPVPRSPFRLPSSSHPSESYVLLRVQHLGFWLYLAGGIGKSTCILSSWMRKF